MACHVIIPVRPANEGKSRLAGSLDPADRISLNNKLFRHVLGVAHQLVDADRITVISHSGELLDVARAVGAHAEIESGRELNAALVQAGKAARDRGATALLSVSSDLPYLDVEDLRAMLAIDSDIVIATDQLRRGTNALLMRPPLAIDYRYGIDSLTAHLDAARAAGLGTHVIERPGLARDLDTPADLAEYRRG